MKNEPLSAIVETEGVSLVVPGQGQDALAFNKSLTLSGIPPEAFGYRLGNRSALEWVIDPYQVKEDRRSGLRSDPKPGWRPGVPRPAGGPGGADQH